MYRRLTDLHLKLDSRTDSAAAWVEASRAFTKAGNSTGAFLAASSTLWGMPAAYGYPQCHRS